MKLKQSQSYYILFILFILSSACSSGYTGEFRDIKVETIKISLPDWLEKTDGLAPHAFYQFKSRYRNTYGIIVKTPKGDKTFKEYQKESVAVLRNFNELTNVLVTDSVFENNIYHLELMGDMQSEKIFYWHNTYETNKNYYQLVLWTRSYDRKEKYGPVIEKIIASFDIVE